MCAPGMAARSGSRMITEAGNAKLSFARGLAVEQSLKAPAHRMRAGRADGCRIATMRADCSSACA